MSPVPPQFEALTPWPQPASHPTKPIPPIKVSGRFLTGVMAGEVLSLIFIPGIGWIPYAGRVAFGLVSTLIYLGDDKGKSYRAELRKYRNASKEWIARQKAPKTCCASSHVQLTQIIHRARSGEFPPLSEIHLEGDFGQRIKRAFKTWYRNGAPPQRKEWEIAANILEGTFHFTEAKSGNIVSAGKVLKIMIECYQGNDEKMRKLWDCVAEESSDIVRELLFNGVNLVSEKEGKIILRWGPRLERDYELGPDIEIIEGEVIENALPKPA